MSRSWSALHHDIGTIADEWRSNRSERQARRSLDPADFERLAKAGFLHVAVPEEMGGLWRSVAETTRPICDVLRTLAAADPSVALVSSMHPAVLGFWLAQPDQPGTAWAAAADGGVRQRRRKGTSGERSPPSRAAAATSFEPKRERSLTTGPAAPCRAAATASVATSTSAAARA